jgi:hypothetical protein
MLRAFWGFPVQQQAFNVVRLKDLKYFTKFQSAARSTLRMGISPTGPWGSLRTEGGPDDGALNAHRPRDQARDHRSGRPASATRSSFLYYGFYVPPSGSPAAR